MRMGEKNLFWKFKLSFDRYKINSSECWAKLKFFLWFRRNKYFFQPTKPSDLDEGMYN